MIQGTFSHFTSVEKIDAGYKNVYVDDRKNFDSAIGRLKELIPQIEELSQIVSRILGVEWPKSSTVTIVPSVCPVAARFIETNTFLAPFFQNDNFFLHIAAHEMTHFLYFHRLRETHGDDIDTEYPSIDWLLSEIVTPIVVNDIKVQEIVDSKDVFFAPDDFTLDDKKKKEIEELFQKYGMEFYDKIKNTG